ncbi:hypothetical protein IE53DRAFT_301358, partial [Violaceomyces palustris]
QGTQSNDTETTTPSGVLKFNLTSGPYDNYFIRTNETSAQVLLTNPSALSVGANQTQSGSSSTLNRFLVALTAGNSGSVTYFLPLLEGGTEGGQGDDSLSVTLDPKGLDVYTPEGDQDLLRGVTGTLVVSSNSTIGTNVLGSIRTVRDYVEGNGLTNQIFNWTVTAANESIVWLSKPWLNESKVRDDQGEVVDEVRYSLEWILQAEQGLKFRVTPSTNGTYTPPKVDLILDGADQVGRVGFKVLTNETFTPGLEVDQLFLNLTNITSVQQAPNARKQFSFLTYKDKFTAGGWRFLTYFGRDSMFTLRLLLPGKTLTPESIEAALGAVISRINSTSGEVCHEETVGDYATFVNLANDQAWKGNDPYYDYKMKDTDYILLPQLADYLIRYNVSSSSNSSSAQRFLSTRAILQNGTTYRELVETNVALVMNTSRAFYETRRWQDLARIKQGFPVGNWRDSNQGLGWGVYPYDVSTALVPAALYAISDLASNGILSNLTSGMVNNASTSTNATDLSTLAKEYAKVWEEESPKFFQFNVSSQDVLPRLLDYVQRTNLSDSLLYGLGSLNLSSSSPSSSDNSSETSPVSGDDPASSMGGLDQGGQTSSSNDSLPSTVGGAGGTDRIIMSLSLDEQGQPIPVQNSDLCFNLLYSRNISKTLIQSVLDSLTPYPAGLLTNVGMLVTNPSLDPNRTKSEELDRRAYHGTVSWGWQTVSMAVGLKRVIGSCQSDSEGADPESDGGGGYGLIRPDWCDDQETLERLFNAQDLLWRSINGAYQERFAEVWSWNFSNETNRFEVVALGDLSPEGTEADAIQLWSFGLLGIQDPTKNGTVSSSAS